MSTVLFVYKNYLGEIRRVHVKGCASPNGIAAALTNLLDTEVTWMMA